MSALTQIKSDIAPGTVWSVTNHFITKPDHPCFGTNQRSVTDTNSASFGWQPWGDQHPNAYRQQWPKAGNVQRDDDGTIRIYGHPKAGDLFLTLRPVS